MQEFTGKVAVVTGAANGIGFALAERFAREGMRVALADVHQPSLDAAAERLRSAGATVLAHQTDVADAASVEALAERVYQEWGAVHVLCNNAGVGTVTTDRAWEHSPETWRWLLNINLFGVIHGIHAFVPRMREGGQEGQILNTASSAGLNPGVAGMAPYSASKHAVVAITESLAAELKAEGAALRASVLCPTWVNTDMGIHSERERSRIMRDAAMPVPPLAMSSMPGVMEPSTVAQAVIEGIRGEQLYILAGSAESFERMVLRHRQLEEAAGKAAPKAK
ncbi:MAG: SDR family NAD(P)-dependent oxidoreductase [Dehalococcoidia bacterium]|uniref:SDR family NAD(P)-dependent oxidoreductase n=1 Tax=Candidatus Amarobacter glycogenicus TaxID=3140699 RepID=UPI0031370544|nr:SDR family NAD(P)-dependent oxidoreductase [Dehalococcoidia bacterium]MBK7330487.1 SDR family NAD(P)-dependent oxidoreductase [Dehalococcoidia bacterium]